MAAPQKSLQEMSLREHWSLFPINITEHNPSWQDWYEDEKVALIQALPANDVVRISHISSTAVKGIWAKPIVDILLEVAKGTDLQEIKNIITQTGYLCMAEKGSRMSFNKGYTLQGFAERVFHLHLRYAGDHDELYFRDYLQTHEVVAKEYEQLKKSLWQIYEHDRDAYTEHKTDFIRRYTDQAKLLFAGRYEGDFSV